MTRFIPGVLLSLALARCQTPLAPAPPMGWNSWDSFGTTVTEAEVRSNADYMARSLARHGWQYVVVDIQWSEQDPKAHGYRPNAELAMDSYGRLVPAPNRFPSSAGGAGFRPLAEYVHRQGLKFGIHIMRGIPRRAVQLDLPIFGSTHKAGEVADRRAVCRWNTDMYGVDTHSPGGQDYYDSIVALYVSWGVDFIKADNILDGDFAPEIEALSSAIRKSGRPIVLSLSPGPARLESVEFLAANAQMWRISGDFWDRWDDLKGQFARLAAWAPHARPGAWPDADMLPLGQIGLRAERGDPRMSLLTHDEQRTLMTLWSIARSPLMFGGNLPGNDAFTLSLLSNDEVLAVGQKATASRELFRRGNQVAWVAQIGESAERFVAVFNLGDAADERIRVGWSALGLPRSCAVRDLWAGKDLGTVAEGRTFQVAPHASAFFRIAPAN
jgi:alpha-galactosidase